MYLNLYNILGMTVQLLPKMPGTRVTSDNILCFGVTVRAIEGNAPCMATILGLIHDVSA